METKFDYNSVPDNFVHCLHDECPNSSKCLRHSIVPYITNADKTIQIVSPAYPASTEGAACHHFKPIRIMRYARGITHLLDHLPHNDAVAIKRQLLSFYGRYNFYAVRNKKRFLKPEETAYIKKLFLQYGISEEPIYDEFVEQYAW